LCNFFKDSLSSSATSSLAPACYFQLFRILHDSVNNFTLLIEDRKYSKDIQDITHKLFELCNSIVALSLEQTTWLRKNYAVKLGPNASSSSTASSSMTLNSQSNASSNNNSMAGTPTAQSGSSSSSGSTIIAGAGPSMGGAILIHNDKTNVSMSNVSIASSNNTTGTAMTMGMNASANTSGYAGSSTMTGSIAGSISNVSNAGVSGNASKVKLNGVGKSTTFSDMENEIASNLSDTTANLNLMDNFNNNFDLNDSNNNLTYSLQALNILAEYLAKTLDIVYKSEEKDRLVVPLLMSLMSNLWPYLKTHS
jgi:hypothetical protein